MNDAATKKSKNSVFSQEKSAAAKLRSAVSSGLPMPNGKENVWREALCMLVPAVNPKCKIFRVTESLPHVFSDFDLADLLDTMANLGYFARSENLRLLDVDERLMPCLFIPDDMPDEPYVCMGAGRFYSASRRAFARLPRRNVAGRCWFFETFSEDKAKTSKAARTHTGFAWFRALAGRFRKALWLIMFLGLVLNATALAAPLFIMVVYDRVLSSGAADVLPALVAGAAMACAVEWMLRSVRTRYLSGMAARAGNIVSNKILAQLLNLAPGYIERASVSAQVARIKTFESVRDFFNSSVFLSAPEIPFTVLALAVIMALSGSLVLVPLGAIALYAALFYFIWRYVRVSIRLAAKAGSARQEFILETVNKMDDIRASGLSRAWQKKFRELSAREAVTSFRLSWLGMVGESCAHGLTILSAVAVIAFGVNMVWAGVLSTGGLVAVMILVWRVLAPFYSLCTMIPRLDQIRNSLRQVDRLMDIETESLSYRHAARLKSLRGRISFSGVGMRYAQDSDPVIAGLSFEAMPGDIVAVTGRNGTGKTTLLKMIKGLYVPQAGSIKIDGFDLRQLDPVDLRRRIAYIPQETRFFHGTVIENLRFSNPLATKREVEIALGQADLLEEITGLPDGLNTMIGHGGLALSSSVALRLSMVRAYLHDAPILLIDELPNSLLSENAGRFMRENILRHKRERTTIIVTHREDFINMADTLVVLRRNLPPQVGPRPFMVNEIKRRVLLGQRRPREESNEKARI